MPEPEPEPEPEPTRVPRSPRGRREPIGGTVPQRLARLASVTVSTVVGVVVVVVVGLALLVGVTPTAIDDGRSEPTLRAGDLVWFAPVPAERLGLDDVVRVRIDGLTVVGRPRAVNRSFDEAVDDTVTLVVPEGELTVPAVGLERARVVLPLVGWPVRWAAEATTDVTGTAALVGLVALVAASLRTTVRLARGRAGGARVSASASGTRTR